MTKTQVVGTTETAAAVFSDCFLRACDSSGILRTKHNSLEIMLSGSFLGLLVGEALMSMEFHGLIVTLLPSKRFLQTLHGSLTFLVLCGYMRWLVREKSQVQPKTVVGQLHHLYIFYSFVSETSICYKN